VLPMSNVVILHCRCTVSKLGVGIRLEETAHGHWEADWTFAVSDQTASREHYGHRQIKGTFTLTSEFPGCPRCGASGFFQCPCGKVSCWSGESRNVTCAWCGRRVGLEGVIDTLSTSGDR
jgi:hypothetical protein